MTDAQKEEYQYKFGEGLPKSPLQPIMTTTIIFWLVISVLILSIGIIYQSPNPEHEQLKPQLLNAFTVFGMNAKIIIQLLAAFLVIWIFQLGLHVYQERKWLRENNIIKVK